MKTTKIGIIGCGNIGYIYFQAGKKFDILEIAACSDIIPERAVEKAKEYNVPKACSTEELLADPEIEIVINLTIPKVHYEIAMAALNAGKHVYNEKPLTLTREQGKDLLAKAKEKNLLVGCAPDTFMGAGLQTCRKLIDDGEIGQPIAASAFVAFRGPESWHPDPETFYKVGAGPMFDIGPYFVTALVNLLGPVQRVAGATKISFPERVITSQPKYGSMIKVETPTHVTGVMDFESGVVGTIITSFDVWASRLPIIEIYGTDGTLSVPDPNTFGGPVLIKTMKDNDWREVPLTHGYSENSRGLGVTDMAYALRSGRAHRASGELAYHVLDLMQSFLDSSNQGKHIKLESTFKRPAPLPLGLRDGILDE